MLPDEQFGRSLADFIANELPALSATIITNRAGAVIDVPREGSVHLTYGVLGSWRREDDPRHELGQGVSKIKQRHGEQALKRIGAILLRGRRSRWTPRTDDPTIEKRSYTLGREIVVLSRKTTGRNRTIVLTSHHRDAHVLKKGEAQ